MASSAVARGYYRPVNASILDGFESEAERGASDSTVTENNINTVPSISLGLQSQPPARPAFQYRATNPAILNDFGDGASQNVPPNRRAASDGQLPLSSSSTTASSGYRPQSDFEEVSQPHGALNMGLRPSQTGPPQVQSRSTPALASSTPAQSNNPYAGLIEARQNAMTTNFLRSQDSLAGGGLPPYPGDEYGFGQRYQLANETAQVVVTNQRMTPEVLSGDTECTVCTDSKPVAQFPGATLTKTCTHPPTTCLDCVAASIRSDLNNRLWNEIRCPECRETLQYDDVQRYADPETRERYQTLSFRYALAEADNFIWCTAGCGYGQVHEGGGDSPIVICLLCGQRSCFAHRVAWHENLACEEYDALQADPANFRSRFELENEAAEEELRLRRAQEDADRVFAQGLVAEELRAEEVARQEKIAREAREKEERAREERRKATEAMRAEVLRKKQEEEKSAATVAKTTKPCPGCGWAIEKNAGCAHMTCIKCSHQFCWDCLADHRRIVEEDNSVHLERCPWHPSNIKD
ncbi:hypothetical protein CONLIGDRAFT_441211 [Coniochaeta ligniaria NRRL 30616]|uniref:RBR-type E3 ubiquitin transferase n=1 Tax=Coniochaeta ligniaria NRRL 30616 TaxID=1408157 RepID=A0A1J7IK02_9PEZI|nr:hypothetical protein CONLIGDRAFT_441211 [Coniochaeta ligniaria NRRL 30616]